MKREEWKDILGYEGYYEVSSTGRVRRSETCKILKQGNTRGNRGYLYVTLSKNGNVKRHRTATIVALSFIQNPDNKKYVNHINGVKTDNRLKNLEWVTSSENAQHAYNTGLRKPVIHSEETKQSQSDRMKGKRKTKDHKERISTSMRGKQNALGHTHTDECKDTISKSLRREDNEA